MSDQNYNGSDKDHKVSDGNHKFPMRTIRFAMRTILCVFRSFSSKKCLFLCTCVNPILPEDKDHEDEPDDDD